MKTICFGWLRRIQVWVSLDMKLLLGTSGVYNMEQGNVLKRLVFGRKRGMSLLDGCQLVSMKKVDNENDENVQ